MLFLAAKRKGGDLRHAKDKSEALPGCALQFRASISIQASRGLGCKCWVTAAPAFPGSSFLVPVSVRVCAGRRVRLLSAQRNGVTDLGQDP